MDLYFFQLINQFAGKWLWLDDLGIFFAKYFEYFLITFLLLFLLFRFGKYWKMVLGALISAVLARLVFVNFVRWIWSRPRPFTLQNFTSQNLGGFIENPVNLLLEHSATASFPSGHAAFYFALSTIVFYKDKDVGVLFFIASILICLARIFVGIHWPSDILAGALVGIFSGWLIKKIFKKF